MQRQCSWASIWKKQNPHFLLQRWKVSLEWLGCCLRQNPARKDSFMVTFHSSQSAGAKPAKSKQEYTSARSMRSIASLVVGVLSQASLHAYIRPLCERNLLRDSAIPWEDHYSQSDKHHLTSASSQENLNLHKSTRWFASSIGRSCS